jgi:hypothetical protein
MKVSQNRSHAVMAQRAESKESLDDFPTPPWATRALIEHVLEKPEGFKSQSCLEPACGEGHMAKVLAEYFGDVKTSDVYPYGYGEIKDFTTHPFEVNFCDWVITNPPFRLGEDFIHRALAVARVGVAMLTRTVFIESVGRYARIFSVTPPTKFAQFTERVPMVKGRLDAKASTATGYCWLVWEKRKRTQSRVVWIPPCRKSLERDGDYELPQSPMFGQTHISAARRKASKGKPGLEQVDLFGT